MKHWAKNMLRFSTDLNAVTAEMEYNGVAVDMEVAPEILKQFTDLKKGFETEMWSLIEKKTKGVDLKEINLGSPKQLSELVYSLKLKDKVMDGKEITFNPRVEWKNFIKHYSAKKSGAKKELQTALDTYFDKLDYGFKAKVMPYFIGANGPSCSKEAIMALNKEGGLNSGAEKFVGLLTELSKVNTWIDLSYYAIMMNVSDDGCVHASFNQVGTHTGRYSSSGPNLQNLPSPKKSGGLNRVRQLMCSRWGKNGVILAPDFSQLELRVLMELSGSVQGKIDYENGIDIHSATAELSANHYHGEGTWDGWDAKKRGAWRDGQKTVNFGLVYGSRPKDDLQEAQKKAFNTRYPEVEKWNNDAIEMIKHFNYYECPLTGFRYNFEGATMDNIYWGYDSKGKGWKNKALNYPVQGTAGRIVQASMIGMYERLIGVDGILFIGQVHDENVLDVRLDCLDEAVKICKEEMEGVSQTMEKYFGKPLTIPMQVDMECGYNWYNVKEVEEFKNEL